MYENDDFKPITYLKTKPAELVKKVNSRTEPIIITQNGEPQMVVMSVVEYKRQRDAIGISKLMAVREAQFVRDGGVSLSELDLAVEEVIQEKFGGIVSKKKRIIKTADNNS